MRQSNDFSLFSTEIPANHLSYEQCQLLALAMATED
jgi:hypothetical protein